MIVVVQLLIAATVYAALAWAMRDRPAVSAPTAAAGNGVRKPWLAYGMLIASAGMFLFATDMTLAGWNPVADAGNGVLGMLTIFVGGVVCAYGLLDRYVRRRGRPATGTPRMRRLMELFVAGFLLLPLTQLFSCTSRHPQNSSRDSSGTPSADPNSAPSRPSP